MKGKGLLVGMSLTLKRFFGKKETVLYPEQKIDMTENFRGGQLQLAENKCIACKICAMNCPNQALDITVKMVEVDNKKKRQLTEYLHLSGRCLYCNFCVESCPTKALSWNRNYELAYYNRDELTYSLMNHHSRGEVK